MRQLRAAMFLLLLGGPLLWANETEYTIFGSLYLQHSAEARGLFYQAYNLAQMRLDLDFQQKRAKPRAVVVDVDETVLDNMPYNGYLAKSGASYPQRWDEWIRSSQAKPIPGALTFLSYAHKKGVRVFYVTNRRQKYCDATITNLTKFAFPDVSSQTVLCRATSDSKEPRRQKILEKYHIVLFIGDNINDFHAAFLNETLVKQKTQVDNLKAEFGRKFILLPNPVYGSWVSAMFDYNWKLSPADRQKKLKSMLIGF